VLEEVEVAGDQNNTAQRTLPGEPSLHYTQVRFSTSHRGGLISSVRRLPGWMHVVGLLVGCCVLAAFQPPRSSRPAVPST